MLEAADLGELQQLESIFASMENKKSIKRQINVGDVLGRTPLYLASANGNIKMVKLLLSWGSDPNKRTNNYHRNPGSTALMVSARKDSSGGCFVTLLEHGADLYAQREDGKNVAYIAAESGNSSIVQKIANTDPLLLHKKVHMNGNRSPIFAASLNGHIDVCKILLAVRVNLNQQNHFGSSPVMLAAGSSHINVVRWMVDNHANICIKRKDGADLLYVATQSGSKDIVEYITKLDKELINRQTWLGRTALFAAAVKGQIKIAQLFLVNGANVNHRDDYKSTSLMWAAYKRRFNMVQWLVENGAEILATDINGKGALEYAHRHRNQEVKEYLDGIIDLGKTWGCYFKCIKKVIIIVKTHIMFMYFCFVFISYLTWFQNEH